MGKKGNLRQGRKLFENSLEFLSASVINKYDVAKSQLYKSVHNAAEFFGGVEGRQDDGIFINIKAFAHNNASC